MKRQIFTILLVLLCFGLTNVYAGWYECYNFKGTIGNYPITLSIQIRKGYFGEKEKKNFNVIGVYKYDKFNNPINLEGKIDFATNKASLYEITGNKYTATIEFEFTKGSPQGVWKNLATKKVLPLELKYISQLLDTVAENEVSDVGILQTNSLPDFYFVGDYSKIAGADRAQMNKLNIIRKKDNSIYQTIDFSKINSQTGNVMTIIFSNVEILDENKQRLKVTNNIGRVGGFLTIVFNSKTKRFILNPEPRGDGPG